MAENPSAEQLTAIVASLGKTLRLPNHASAQRLAANIVERGWASFADIEDIFYATDVRLDDLRHDVDVRAWCTIFDVPLVAVYPRPRAKQATFISSESVRAADVTELLIQLERVGYAVDPMPYVELLEPRLRTQDHVTRAELSVLRYKKERQRTVALTLSLNWPWPDTESIQKRTLATGYKLEAWFDGNDQPIHLTVRAPKYRRRPEPVKTVCAVCGVEWYRGDPDSSAAHRSAHKQRLGYLEPAPVPQFVAALAEDRDAAELVSHSSARWKHKEIYQRALAFQREFRYDFVQWLSPKGDKDPNVHGFLFAGPGDVIAGACAFRLREHEGRTWWGLQWVWVAPKFRCSGLLSSRWPMFREKFGSFVVESPLSKAMQGFLAKHDDIVLAAED
ncbi:hypothetical protein EZH22_01560 [Xanthobacter dioxanivorans]|uniref:N-acetyltransferase ESCO zinc-finger domain-containing protein n=1 Tax=Xanthobacter dioxanivorans TaxID=2528964 RepID=A0A974PPN8_9HYPH|nr:hypothetical protein [Xanthobacter dioxanivorans]QRG07161.1 hypothetical protein EZH22_01560 [Xanthobacter dioxanivorans]